MATARPRSWRARAPMARPISVASGSAADSASVTRPVFQIFENSCTGDRLPAPFAPELLQQDLAVDEVVVEDLARDGEEPGDQRVAERVADGGAELARGDDVL